MKRKIFQMLLLGMCVLFTSNTFAQVKVSGVVKSSSGEALPGATVVVKGTTNGVVTDNDGNYTISVPNAQSTLVISFIGMESQDIALNGKTSVNVALAPTAVAVNEVVVTALGMKREKRAIGYDVSNVTGDKIATGGVSNALKSLDGKITGVQINSVTSSPTSSVMFNIRGATSLQGIMGGWTGNINNQTQPLIVVNGVPVATNTVSASAGVDVGNFMSALNPNEIESVSILKGASAAALYGASAGNGVIVITTKDGSKAKKGLGISINSSTSIDQAFMTPPVNRQFFQGGEEGEPLTDDKQMLGWNINDTKNNVGSVPAFP